MLHSFTPYHMVFIGQMISQFSFYLGSKMLQHLAKQSQKSYQMIFTRQTIELRFHQRVKYCLLEIDGFHKINTIRIVHTFVNMWIEIWIPSFIGTHYLHSYFHFFPNMPILDTLFSIVPFGPGVLQLPASLLSFISLYTEIMTLQQPVKVHQDMHKHINTYYYLY